jgi:hypothetical protein
MVIADSLDLAPPEVRTRDMGIFRGVSQRNVSVVSQPKVVALIRHILPGELNQFFEAYS